MDVIKMVRSEDGTYTPFEPIYKDVLDHGYVGLIDFMGDDSRIVNSARVSYGAGTKKTRNDRGLIRYLMRHHHSTPFESVEFQFHVKAPIFVLRQWMRHRTACLSGDNQLTVYADGEMGAMSVKFLFNLYKNEPNSVRGIEIPTTTADGEMSLVKVHSIWETGEKEVFDLIAAPATHGDGFDSILTASKDHRVLTMNGWSTVGDIKAMIEQGVRVSIPMIYGGVFRVGLVEEVKPAGRAQTYDMEVGGLAHSFSANGIIVHNSYNEYSGRYSILENDYYVPDGAVTAPQSKSANQGREPVSVSDADYEAISRLLRATCEQSYLAYEQLTDDSVQVIVDDILEGVAREILMTDSPDAEGVVAKVLSAHLGMSGVQPIARELARMVLPLNIYSQMYWKVNLKNLMHFLWLREDSHAQYEIQEYARAIKKMIQPIAPIAMEAYEDYQAGSFTLSRMEKSLISSAIRGNIDLSNEDLVRKRLKEMGASDREIREFLEIGGNDD